MAVLDTVVDRQAQWSKTADHLKRDILAAENTSWIAKWTK